MSSPPESLPEFVESVPPSTPSLMDTSISATPVEIASAPAEKPFPAWSGWDVLAVFAFSAVTVLVFMMIAILAAYFINGHHGSPMDDVKPYIPVAIGAQAAAYPVILLFIFFLVRSRSHKSFGKAISWNWPGMRAPLFAVSGVVLAFAIERLARLLPTPKSIPMDEYFTDATNAYLMAGLGVLLAPIIEEMLFRGLLYPVLRRWAGVVAAVLVTALAFAAIHFSQLGYAWGPAFSIFVVGVVLTLVRERTSSLASSYLMHFGYNFALFGALWLSTDHFRHLEKAVG